MNLMEGVRANDETTDNDSTAGGDEETEQHILRADNPERASSTSARDHRRGSGGGVRRGKCPAKNRSGDAIVDTEAECAPLLAQVR